LTRNTHACSWVTSFTGKKEIDMATPKESLLDWLRDTHAMEQQAEKMLYEANASGRYPFIHLSL
jgi:hypothetical protein